MERYFDRRSGKIVSERTYKKDTLDFLYGRRFGRVLRQLIVSRPIFSKLYTKRMYRRSSVSEIPAFIEENGIKTGDFVSKNWTCLADFFIREPKAAARPWDPDPQRMPSPADARLMAYSINEHTEIQVKGFTYEIAELLHDPDLAYAYCGGICLIYRLTMADCHRFYHIDDGTMVSASEAIRGRLHTVGPLSDGRQAVLRENSRVVSILDTKHLGTVAQIEVGALTVGSIINHDMRSFKRGDEKGYFQPGGSTIVQLIQADRLKIDEDIAAASLDGIETKVLLGEGIGRFFAK